MFSSTISYNTLAKTNQIRKHDKCDNNIEFGQIYLLGKLRKDP